MGRKAWMPGPRPGMTRRHALSRHERPIMPTLPSRHLSVRIERPWRDVYDVLSEPANFARWASGLGGGLVEAGGVWRADTPDGAVTIAFTPRNDFGVVDHQVLLPSGAKVE